MISIIERKDTTESTAQGAEEVHTGDRWVLVLADGMLTAARGLSHELQAEDICKSSTVGKQKSLLFYRYT